MKPICVYDFTVPDMDLMQLKETLKKHCKKWAFQKEKGSTGYIHYQGRLSLKLKKRLKNVLEIFILMASIFLLLVKKIKRICFM